MSLFDVPHPAHLASNDQPVLWFGVVVMGDKHDRSETTYAIIANPTGRLSLLPFDQIIADVRHITERENIVPGQTGPGWVDLEDLEAAAKSAKQLAQAFAPESPPPAGETAVAADKAAALTEGTDYITDKEGNWFHPVSGKELDKSTGQPIE